MPAASPGLAPADPPEYYYRTTPNPSRDEVSALPLPACRRLPLVGQWTWGGLVGTLGFPRPVDGGSVTAPSLAIWAADEGRVVEKVGVAPDIEGEQTPAGPIGGRAVT